MKKIFPLLLCYVLSTSQLFALSGGPVFTSGISPIGLFSGTLQGVSETNNQISTGPAIPGDPLTPVNNTNVTASNALGLFTLGVPATNAATGAFLLFADGYVFTGTITATVDPSSDKLVGILEGSYNFSLTTFNATGDAVTTAVTASALGKINAGIRAGRGNSTSARLGGTANLDINFGTVDTTTLAPIINRSITFTVSGFQQSTNVTSAGTFMTQPTGGGGGGT